MGPIEIIDTVFTDNVSSTSDLLDNSFFFFFYRE